MLSQPLCERLLALNWFAFRGDPPQAGPLLTDIAYLTREQMQRSYASLAWQRAINQARNRMSSYLSVNHHARYNKEWNVVATEAAAFFDGEPREVFAGFRGTFLLSQGFVIWNRVVIIHLFHGEHYRELGVDTAFWDRCLACYEAGRYPCGWIAPEWPEGQLAVW